MMLPQQDRYTHIIYPALLNHLRIIETKLSNTVIDFNASLSLGDAKKETSSPIKTAWCLYRISTLLKNATSTPIAHKQSWIKKAGFFIRLYQSRTELNECLLLMTCISSNSYYFPINTDEMFLLGCLYWELLQVLNPKFCPESEDFWEILYHGSPAWQYAFQYAPGYLYSNLLLYLNTKEAPDREFLLSQIQDLNFSQSISDENFGCVSARVKRINIFAQSRLNLPVLENNHKHELEKRMSILNFLSSELSAKDSDKDAETIDSNQLLGRTLDEYSWSTLCSAFESPILEPNTYVHLNAIDKLRFIYDVLVSKPVPRNVSPDAWSSLIEYGAAVLPESFIRMGSTFTPAELFIRKHKGEESYQLSEINPNLYAQISNPRAKRQSDLGYANCLLQQLTLRLNEERILIQKIEGLEIKIKDYYVNREQFMRQFSCINENLTHRLEYVQTYQGVGTLSEDYENYCQHFNSAGSLLSNIQNLKKLIEHIAISEELANRPLTDFPIEKKLKVLRTCFHEITLENEALNHLYSDLNDIAQMLLKYEADYRQKSADFSFPPPNPEKLKLPYMSVLALLLASTGIAISVGLLTGNPVFTFMVAPVLIQYMAPFYLALTAVSAVVATQASLNLLKYTFFAMDRLSPHADINVESVSTIQFH